MDLGIFVQVLEHQRLIMDYMYMSGAAILIYDYLLTVHLEIKSIWLSRWTYTKVLFLLIRYTALASAIIMLHNQVFLDLSEQNCKTIFPVGGYMIAVQTALAELVIAVRTWAVWNRRKIIGAIVGVPLFISLLWTFIAEVKFYNAIEYSAPPYPGYRGCFLIKAPSQDLWSNFLLLIVLEATVLTLMVISAFALYRSSNFSKLSHVIHRDGILYYIFLLCITVASVIVTVVEPTDMKFLLDPLLYSMHPVLVSRIVLNIRQAANRGQQTELHTSYHEPMAFATPLGIASGAPSLPDHSALIQLSMRSQGAEREDGIDP